MGQMNQPTPEQLAQFAAWQAQQQRPQQAQPPAYPPPPTAGYQPPPAAYAPPPQGMPHGVQTQAVDDDFIGNLPPADLPGGRYDLEVLYVETKSGVSDKGTAWENLRYRFTVLSGPLAGQSVVISLSTKFTRPLYSLAEACGKPIIRDAAGNVAFSKRSLNGCRVNAEVSYKRGDYPDVVDFKPIGR